MSQQIDKILGFRTDNFGLIFIPMSKFRGALNIGSGYLELHFDDMRGVSSGNTTDAFGTTTVTIRFNSGDFFKEAVEEMIAKIYSSNSPVITVVDATVPYNETFIRSAIFGKYNQYLHGHSTNTDVPSPTVSTTLAFALQSES